MASEKVSAGGLGVRDDSQEFLAPFGSKSNGSFLGRFRGSGEDDSYMPTESGGPKDNMRDTVPLGPVFIPDAAHINRTPEGRKIRLLHRLVYVTALPIAVPRGHKSLLPFVRAAGLYKRL